MLKQCVKSLRPIATCTALVWLLLIGIAFAEDLGFFRDTFESGDPQIEQLLSSDIIEDAQAADYVGLVHPSPSAILSLSALHLLYPSPRSCADISESVVRMKRGFKLYRLHSAYLI